MAAASLNTPAQMTTADTAEHRAARLAFEQSKLSRREWEGLEVPLPPDETEILKMIMASWNDPDVCTNPRRSVLRVTKLGTLSSPHDFIYDRFLHARVSAIAEKLPGLAAPRVPDDNASSGAKSKRKTKMSAADSIRLANIDFEALTQRVDIWDFALLALVAELVKTSEPIQYYTLARALDARVDGTNRHLLQFADQALHICKTKIEIIDMIKDIEPATELNPVLQTFANRRLYQHQRDLIAALKVEGPKLVLYQAPTGTGKTLSPIAVSEGYKVIFVCASKHVGMQLARACISIHKRVAVAFGCQDAGDVRLHFYAVTECIRKRRSGAIGKIDHSQGQKVEIIIADATSYLSAMRYMLSWNAKESLLVYWDEPTIAMDKKTDELHDIVRRSWRENEIPNIVLSSATLPPPSDLPRFIQQTQTKFGIADDHVITISNYECARTVPILLKTGHVAMPHVCADTSDELTEMVAHCTSRATLLRHIDLGAAARFLLAAAAGFADLADMANPLERFETIEDVTPETVKRAYLDCLVPVAKCLGMEALRTLTPEPRRFTGGVEIGTRDAVSITHGPVLYLAIDTDKVAKFIIKNADPPADIIDTLYEQAHVNEAVSEQIAQLEKDLADHRDGGDDDSDDEMEHGGAIAHKLEAIRRKLTEMRLPDREVPNTEEHQRRYHSTTSVDAFKGSVPPHHLMEVLRLSVDNWKKMLLMMGIGVFGEECPTYRELMSRMASERELFCVIAGTDYVYGTNYQFCHGYIGRDLGQMPVEKLYQALGRVGRGRQAGQYSWRLRDDSVAKRVFSPDTELTEARRMDRLMSGV